MLFWLSLTCLALLLTLCSSLSLSLSLSLSNKIGYNMWVLSICADVASSLDDSLSGLVLSPVSLFFSLLPLHGNVLPSLSHSLSFSLSLTAVSLGLEQFSRRRRLLLFLQYSPSVHEAGIYCRQLKELVIESNGWTIHLSLQVLTHGTRFIGQEKAKKKKYK